MKHLQPCFVHRSHTAYTSESSRCAGDSLAPTHLGARLSHGFIGAIACANAPWRNREKERKQSIRLHASRFDKQPVAMKDHSPTKLSVRRSACFSGQIFICLCKIDECKLIARLQSLGGSKFQPKKIWFKALEFSATARMNGIHGATTWITFGLTLVTSSPEWCDWDEKGKNGRNIYKL